LRGLSAPVEIVDDLTSEERFHLMAYDGDHFNRWDQGQRLAKQAILAMAKGAKGTDGDASALVQAYRQVLGDETILDDYKALMLILPSLAVLEPASVPADPPALFKARQTLLGRIGEGLADEVDAALANHEKHESTPGGRALLVRFLALGIAAGNERAIETAETLSRHSNMTLSQGALGSLIHFDYAARQRSMDAFYERWHTDSLVIEKWFQMESMSAVAGHVGRIGELMQDACFDPNSPNKIRCVLGAFMGGNTLNFHANDGSGYRYMAEQIGEIDARNAQLAARLVLPLTRMVNYDDARRKLMCAALELLGKSAKSNDLREIVEKALQVHHVTH